ncbi:MAG: hypothetical protein OZX49_00175 [Immundisolibacter sp.]|nr:hypothetical protein [Immundisolibacter sp.]
MAGLAEEHEQAPPWLWLGRGVLLALALLVGWFIRQQIFLVQDPHERPQRITLISPPPPQSPKPPPPEPQVETLPDMPVPEMVTSEPLPETAGDDRLGLDETAGAGSDSFGLAAKRGGQDWHAAAQGNAGEANPRATYGRLIEQHLRQLFDQDAELRRQAFSATVTLWLQSDGSILRFKINDGSGNRRTDERLLATLATARSLPPPPPGVPLVVRLRVRVRES